jgi:ABC-type multidrug transport system ATPase subunit
VTDRQYLIETQGLTRHFGKRTVVDQLSLLVPESGIYGFLGPNGAGKTTTIRLLLGLIRPDAGHVQIFGEQFDRNLLNRIGSLVEMPSLYTHLSGRENLEVTRRQIGAAPASIERVLAIVRLTSDANRLVGEYSLGMKQRLGLALALLNSPDLLILDEPTNGLDPAGIHEMRDLLRRMPSEYGVTVFLSSHLLSEVEQIADSVGIIHGGRMIFQGSLTQLRERQTSQLTIGVRRTARALEFLRASGIDARLAGPDFIRVSDRRQEAHGINRLLTENGYDVFHVSLEEESLENIFLSMTCGGTQ